MQAPPAASPKLLWKTFLRGCDSPAAAAGRHSYLAHEKFATLVDPAGRIAYSREIGPTDATPALDERYLYIGTEAGALVALERKTGKPLWRFQSGNAIKSAPALGGGRVYVESLDNYLYAIEAASGTLLWKQARPDGSLGFSAPTLGGAAALYACGEATLYRLDPLSGSIVWRASVGGKALSTPAWQSGRLFVGGDGTGVTAHSEDDGARRWRFLEKSDDWYGPPLVAGRTVFAASLAGRAHALDAETGRPLWSVSLPGEALAALALDSATGLLYITLSRPRSDISLLALDARTGKRRHTFNLGSILAAPVIVGDRLFVGSQGGYYHAFSLR